MYMHTCVCIVYTQADTYTFEALHRVYVEVQGLVYIYCPMLLDRFRMQQESAHTGPKCCAAIWKSAGISRKALAKVFLVRLALRSAQLVVSSPHGPSRAW